MFQDARFFQNGSLEGCFYYSSRTKSFGTTVSGGASTGLRNAEKCVILTDNAARAIDFEKKGGIYR